MAKLRLKDEKGEQQGLTEWENEKERGGKTSELADKRFKAANKKVKKHLGRCTKDIRRDS